MIEKDQSVFNNLQVKDTQYDIHSYEDDIFGKAKRSLSVKRTKLASLQLNIKNSKYKGINDHSYLTPLCLKDIFYKDKQEPKTVLHKVRSCNKIIKIKKIFFKSSTLDINEGSRNKKTQRLILKGNELPKVNVNNNVFNSVYSKNDIKSDNRNNSNYTLYTRNILFNKTYELFNRSCNNSKTKIKFKNILLNQAMEKYANCSPNNYRYNL